MKAKEKITVAGAIFMAVALLLLLPCLSIAGSIEPPGNALDISGNPVPTMKTLDEIPPAWSQKLRADDGDADGCNSSRFKCVMDGSAVLDRETGLVWGIGASSFHFSWTEAQRVCNQEAAWGWRFGWRLPTLQELASLIDILTNTDPALPNGHPFAYYGECNYWSSTSYAGDDSKAWYVDFCYPRPGYADKSSGFHLWCVRGGQGVE
jgi:hypothetical protein